MKIVKRFEVVLEVEGDDDAELLARLAAFLAEARSRELRCVRYGEARLPDRRERVRIRRGVRG